MQEGVALKYTHYLTQDVSPIDWSIWSLINDYSTLLLDIESVYMSTNTFHFKPAKTDSHMATSSKEHKNHITKQHAMFSYYFRAKELGTRVCLKWGLNSPNSLNLGLHVLSIYTLKRDLHKDSAAKVPNPFENPATWRGAMLPRGYFC